MVLLAALAAVLLRLPLLGGPARPDEAGYLLVARAVRRAGPFLYGDLWVDRPPLLVLAFRVADGIGGVRVLGLLAAAVLAAAAADAGWTLGGRAGALCAGAVAAALPASPLLSAPAVDGELLALPFVLAALALGLRALLPSGAGADVAGRTPGRAASRPAVLLAAAGVLGGSALLVKQNLAEALVVLGLLLLVQAVRGELGWRRASGLEAPSRSGPRCLCSACSSGPTGGGPPRTRSTTPCSASGPPRWTSSRREVSDRRVGGPCGSSRPRSSAGWCRCCSCWCAATRGPGPCDSQSC